jgi:hypothetical protein
MVCEHLKTCDYIHQLSEIDPFTRMIRTMNCWHIQNGCEKECIHLASEIDQIQDCLRFKDKTIAPQPEK